MKKAMATIGISVMSIAVIASNASASEVVVVSAESLNMRSEPESDAYKVGRLLKGDKVTVIEKTEFWVKVKTDDGKTGWISSDYVETSETEEIVEEEESNETAYVSNANGLNVRENSSMESGLLFTIAQNTKVNIIEENDNGWNKIKLENGSEGWVIATRLSKEKADVDKAEQISKEESDQNEKTDNDNKGDYATKEVNNSDSSDKTKEVSAFTGKVKVKSEKGLNVRKESTADSAIITTLSKGEVVKAIGKTGSWTKIKLDDGRKGWISSNGISTRNNSGKKVLNDKRKYAKNNTGDNKSVKKDNISLTVSRNNGVKLKVKVNGSLNVRSGPGTGNSIIGSLHNGDIVERIGISGSWIKIKMSGGRTGWVKSEYLVSPGTSGLTDSKPSEGGVKLKVKVNGSLNVRSGPGTGNSVIGSLHNGDIVKRIGVSGSWSKIKMSGGKTGWVNSRYITSDKENRGSMNGGSTSSRNIISIAKSKLGSKYRWGATGPNEFDCSGYTQWVFGQAGKSIPRISRDQARGGTAVSKSQMQPGDLVYFNTGRNGVVNHVGIYLGNNQFIHCSGTPRKPKYVMISSLGGFYGEVFMGARRY